MTRKVTVQYIFDPLCGWCYGASASMLELAQHPGVDVQPMASGLFSGRGARPMAGFAAQAWQYDQQIARLSGRTFSEAYRKNVLGAQDAMLDSSVATLALTAVAQEAPEREIEVLKVIQEARYVSGHDITSQSVVVDLLIELGLPHAASHVTSPDERFLQSVNTRTRAAQNLMAEFGVQGVPALIVGTGTSRRAVDTSPLYAGPNHVLAALGLA